MTALVRSANSGATGASSYTVTVSTTAGDALVLFVLAYMTGNTPVHITSITDDASGGSNTWRYSTAAANQNPPANGAYSSAHAQYGFSAIAVCLPSDNGGTVKAITSVTVTLSAFTAYGEAGVAEFSGLPSGSVVLGAASNATNAVNTTSYALPSVSASSGNPMLALSATSGFGSFTAAGTGFTFVTDADGNNLWAYDLAASSGTVSETMTTTASQDVPSGCMLVLGSSAAPPGVSGNLGLSSLQVAGPVSGGGGSGSRALAYMGGYTDGGGNVNAAGWANAQGVPEAGGFQLAYNWGQGWTGTNSVHDVQVSMANGMAGYTGPCCLSVAMTQDQHQTDLSSALSGGALTAGCQTAHADTAVACLASGVQYIRMAWEFNGGSGYNWMPPFGSYTAADFKLLWQLIYNVYSSKAVAAGKPANWFKFVYCMNPADSNGAANMANYYPGMPYAAYITIDEYDRSNGGYTGWNQALNDPPGLAGLVTFALAQGAEGIGMPEWGIRNDAYGPTVIPDPSYITSAFAWAKAATQQGLNVLLWPWGAGYNGSISGISPGTWDFAAWPTMWSALTSAVATGISEGWIGTTNPATSAGSNTRNLSAGALGRPSATMYGNLSNQGSGSRLTSGSLLMSTLQAAGSLSSPPFIASGALLLPPVKLAGTLNNPAVATLVQSANSSAGFASSYTVSISTTAGDALALFVLAYMTGNSPVHIVSVTDNASGGSNTWRFSTAAASQNPPANGSYSSANNQYGFSAIAVCLPSDNGGTVKAITSVTVTLSAGTQYGEAGVAEFSGLPSGSVLLGAASNGTIAPGATTYALPSVSASSGTAILALSATSGFHTFTGAGGNWSFVTDTDGNNLWAYNRTPASGTVSETMTGTTAQDVPSGCMLVLGLPVPVSPPFPSFSPAPSLPPRQPWRFLYGPRAPGGSFAGAIEQASARRVTLRAEPDQNSQVSWEMDGRDQAAAAITELETDVTVMYGGQYVFAGRVGASQDVIDSAAHRTQFTASDYRDVLRRQLLLTGDTLTYTNAEQQKIAWGLIQSVQAHAGANLGIVQGLGQAGSGVRRTMTFTAGDYAGDDISTMAGLANGFEWLIQPYGPGDLRFDFYYPKIGKQAGRVFALGMSRVQSITRVVDPSTYANAVHVSADPSVVLIAQELTAPGIATSPQGRWDQLIGSTMKTQSSLNDYAAQALAAAQVIVPAYTIVLQPGSWTGPGDVWLGDMVNVRVQSGRLNVNDQLRVVEMDFAIDANNLEVLTLTVGAIPLQVHRLIPKMLKNLALLNTR